MQATLISLFPDSCRLDNVLIVSLGKECTRSKCILSSMKT